MEVNRLLGDELTYELEIRGLPVPSTVLGKRSTLRGALRMEKEGMTMPIGICTFLDSASEMAICTTKLEELIHHIQNFNSENKLNEYKRISSRLCHLRLRLCRIPITTEDFGKEKEQLLIGIMQNMEALGNLMDEQEDTGPRGSSEGNLLDEDNPREVSIMDERIPLLPELSNTARPKEKQVPLVSLRDGPTASHSSFLRETDNLIREMQEARGRIREHNSHLFDVLHGQRQGNRIRQNQSQSRMPEDNPEYNANQNK